MKLQQRRQAEFDAAQQRRQEELEAALSKFRNPVMLAARELESRLVNILVKNFGWFYTDGTQPEKDYAVKNTAFVFAQYFAWRELLHQEVQYLDVGTLEKTGILHARFEAVRHAFSHWYSSADSRLFRLFGGEQRACGEGLIVELGGGRRLGFGCMGYAKFLETSKHSPWVERIRHSFITFVKDERSEEGVKAKERLVQIQNALIDLMNSLDPLCAYHSHASKKLCLLEATEQRWTGGT